MATGEQKEKAETIEGELVALLEGHKQRLLELGASGRLLIAGELEDTLPLEDADALEQAKPITISDKMKNDPQKIEARYDAHVRAMTKEGPVAEKEVVAGLIDSNFLLAISHDDLNLRASQPVRLEPGPKVGQPLRPPMLHGDVFGSKFDEVEAAAPDNEPHDTAAIARRKLEQALGSTLKHGLPGVFEGPLNGVSDGPGVPGVGVEEVEAVVGVPGEETLGKDQRGDGGGGGFQEVAAVEHGDSLGWPRRKTVLGAVGFGWWCKNSSDNQPQRIGIGVCGPESFSITN